MPPSPTKTSLNVGTSAILVFFSSSFFFFFFGETKKKPKKVCEKCGTLNILEKILGKGGAQRGNLPSFQTPKKKKKKKFLWQRRVCSALVHNNKRLSSLRAYGRSLSCLSCREGIFFPTFFKRTTSSRLVSCFKKKRLLTHSLGISLSTKLEKSDT